MIENFKIGNSVVPQQDGIVLLAGTVPTLIQSFNNADDIARLNVFRESGWLTNISCQKKAGSLSICTNLYRLDCGKTLTFETVSKDPKIGEAVEQFRGLKREEKHPRFFFTNHDRVPAYVVIMLLRNEINGDLQKDDRQIIPPSSSVEGNVFTTASPQ